MKRRKFIGSLFPALAAPSLIKAVGKRDEDVLPTGCDNDVVCSMTVDNDKGIIESTAEDGEVTRVHVGHLI